MCALLNFIKVFCIVLHILTIHSFLSSIYFPQSPHQRGHDPREIYVAALINFLILATGKMAPGL